MNSGQEVAHANERRVEPAGAGTEAESGAPAPVGPDERMEMIAQAAYLRAEKSGFSEDPLVDWLEAEREIDAMLKERESLPAGRKAEAQAGVQAQA